MNGVRELATCLGLLGPPISVRSLLGGAPPLSLRDRLDLVLQRQFDLNVILLGAEHFDEDDRSEIAFAIEHTRATFAAVDLGIGRITQYAIPVAESHGHSHIASDSEADDVWHTWGFPGIAIDLFFVQTYDGPVVGRAPQNGPCKRDGDSHGGLVVAVEHIPSITANTLAHELGHYLGLWHEVSPDNLMFEHVPNGGALNPEQGVRMKSHCIVYTGCRRP